MPVEIEKYDAAVALFERLAQKTVGKAGVDRAVLNEAHAMCLEEIRRVENELKTYIAARIALLQAHHDERVAVNQWGNDCYEERLEKENAQEVYDEARSGVCELI